MIACAHRMRFVRGAWQGTEGTTNPATRQLVKSLMKVLSFLMGRRRKVVPTTGVFQHPPAWGALVALKYNISMIFVDFQTCLRGFGVGGDSTCTLRDFSRNFCEICGVVV